MVLPSSMHSAVLAGGDALAVAMSAAAVTLTPTQLQHKRVLLVDTGAANVALNLPAAALMKNRIFTIKKTDANANDCIITPDGAETIDGAASNAGVDAQYDSMTIYCDGTAWWILHHTLA